jgi:type II secretory pathway component PulK
MRVNFALWVWGRNKGAARPFQSVDGLKKVKEIGPKKFEQLRPLVVVGGEKLPDREQK